MSGTQNVIGTVEQAPLRRAISVACRLPEAECIAALLPAATLPPEAQQAALAMAADLVQALRARQPSRLAALLHAYPLGSKEGQALMELAEALLRIPDLATRHDLLRDKLVGRHWHANPELRLAASLAASPLWPLAAPIVRYAAVRAVREMANAFVLGETMVEALPRIMAGFRYSYDMLGEAALTVEEADQYESAYESAISAARNGGTIYENDGVSIKLSALHPRYCRTQRARVMAELLPRLTRLAQLARDRNIGLTIDAEEADRLDLSLDLLQALCEADALSNWNGLGLAVQAYQKRAPAILDFCADLARGTGRRLMVRLVKGAYWDSEIKQAQISGHADYPVFTRKAHTDISYLACARKLLEAGPLFFPQFATHNALTMAAIHAMAGEGDYEFQCLHGMGEDLYEEWRKRAPIPCRIYAPVGPHARLLAYLSRRLLENGANGSFINQLHDHSRPIPDILRDPVEATLAENAPGAPHPSIPLPRNLFGIARRNSAGLDLTDEPTIASLESNLTRDLPWPKIHEATPAILDAAFTAATSYKPPPPAARHAILLGAADAIAQHHETLLNFLVREGAKTIPAALAELREAEDYCRYYAAQIKDWQKQTHIPLGPVICISPWNFPLAIFLGQIAGAFAAGNAVLAKPAEETPSIAAYIVSILHQSDIPRDALHLIQGDGTVGATLAADPRTRGVVFTGSIAAARAIQETLSRRINPGGVPVPLIAETGGQNAMIADSSALPEQLIADILFSAFDSAGQRCSALRLLCLQRELVPLVLPRLRAALRQLTTDNPALLATDLGPVINAAAQAKILTHLESCRDAGYRITQGPAPARPNFVPPTIIEIPDLSCLREEIFGPVLHVLSCRRAALPHLPRRINALGYGLTFGLHSRLESRTRQLAGAIHAGNIYVNRNIVGAVVGVQPFGGEALSGTGPKAGGPLYVHRLLRTGPACWPLQGELPGPVGERNLYRLQPRRVLCSAKTSLGHAAQLEAVKAAGARAVFRQDDDFSAVLLEGEAAEVQALAAALATRPGPLIQIVALSSAALAAGALYNPAWLVHERSICVNSAAAGGNAALMAAITP
ncbi:MAG TPA: L-glutamate gamma-semialdehyde dehydrogenase [Acidocella sp.]|jgi:RHH-type proline utilization regulon transcriptional repressor/proline dehydrogenase/delta 1-pyrroline-5-carboxylate dehydrogenase|nr:L-glutamate gamma-semialdehyde dehydrogenase [Acidocella sp.]